MNSYCSVNLKPLEIQALKVKLLKLAPVTPLLAEPKFAALVAALGIQQEVGSLNDELSRFIFDAAGAMIPRECLKAEIIDYRGFIGVRIWADGYDRLDLRLKGLRELLHPSFSLHTDGSVRQCVFFIHSLAKIAKLQGAELVLVREWAINTIFGGFNRNKLFYETNVWELVHNDSLRYAELLEKKQIAMLGTHDLTAHLSGISATAIEDLQILGSQTRQRFLSYFGLMKKHSVYTLVLPYAAGVLLDDLAQPKNYSSSGRRLVFEILMRALDQRKINPAEPRVLLKFPEAYEKLINLARSADFALIQAQALPLCHKLIQELEDNSISFENSNAMVSAITAIN